MTNLCQKYQRRDQGRGGGFLAFWLLMNFEYWSKFPGDGLQLGGKEECHGGGFGGAVLAGSLVRNFEFQ